MLLPINKPPEKWTEEDLKQICNDKTPENIRLDFKRKLNLETEKSKFELLKDVTSFANAFGGVIIYGIGEDKSSKIGKADKLYKMDDEGLCDRASRIIYSHISPKVEFYIYRVPSLEDGFYIIIYVPQHYLKPYSFTSDNNTYWYKRCNQDNVELTEPDIREMYFQSYQIRQNIRHRYDELDLDIDTPAKIAIVSMPLIPELSLINTLHNKSNEFLKYSYTKITNGSNYLEPRIDRFEEVIHRQEKIIVTRLFQHGEFMFSYGFPSQESHSFASVCDVYRLLHYGIQYFGELYSDLNYYGDIRLWFEVKDLKNNNIKVKHTINETHDYDFKRKQVLIWKDIKLDAPIKSEEISGEFITYFLHGIGETCSNRMLENIKSRALY